MNIHKRCQKNVANNCGINTRQMAEILGQIGVSPNAETKVKHTFISKTVRYRLFQRISRMFQGSSSVGGPPSNLQSNLVLVNPEDSSAIPRNLSDDDRHAELLEKSWFSSYPLRFYFVFLSSIILYFVCSEFKRIERV